MKTLAYATLAILLAACANPAPIGTLGGPCKPEGTCNVVTLRCAWSTVGSGEYFCAPREVTWCGDGGQP